MDARDVNAALDRRYVPLFALGQGGMGTVEAAVDTSDQHSPQRVVALKRLLPSAMRDPRRVEMFLREARIATLVDHPNVVRALDYGNMSGEYFLALEFIEGQTLSRLLEEMRNHNASLEPKLVAWMLSRVCLGLDAAHNLLDPDTHAPLSVVHRDVSPQNIMLGYDGSVRLLDFGIAKTEAENVTKTGEIKGKAAYMSPEQAMGEPLDRRSDLFGLGAVLYECITLRRMWGDGPDMEVFRKLALETPPALAPFDVGSPEELCTLHTKLVARDRAERPATAREVAEQLQALAGDPNACQSELIALLAHYFDRERRSQQTALLRSSEQLTAEAVSPEPPRTSNRRRVGAAWLVPAGFVLIGLTWRAWIRASDAKNPSAHPPASAATQTLVAPSTPSAQSTADAPLLPGAENTGRELPADARMAAPSSTPAHDASASGHQPAVVVPSAARKGEPPKTRAAAGQALSPPKPASPTDLDETPF